MYAQSSLPFPAKHPAEEQEKTSPAARVEGLGKILFVDGHSAVFSMQRDQSPLAFDLLREYLWAIYIE